MKVQPLVRALGDAVVGVEGNVGVLHHMHVLNAEGLAGPEHCGHVEAILELVEHHGQRARPAADHPVHLLPPGRQQERVGWRNVRALLVAGSAPALHRRPFPGRRVDFPAARSRVDGERPFRAGVERAAPWKAPRIVNGVWPPRLARDCTTDSTCAAARGAPTSPVAAEMGKNRCGAASASGSAGSCSRLVRSTSTGDQPAAGPPALAVAPAAEDLEIPHRRPPPPAAARSTRWDQHPAAPDVAENRRPRPAPSAAPDQPGDVGHHEGGAIL